MLRIHLFSSLRLFYQDQPLKFSALPKTLPLWSYLLLNRKQVWPRPLLAYTLWPDVNEAEARSNLRRHLYELRRVLPAASDGCSWVLADNSGVQWNPCAPYWLDVEEFTRLHAAAHTNPLCLAEAVQLYTGDLLPEVDDERIFLERERLRNLFGDALTRLIAHHRTAQEYSQAISYAQKLLHHDPLREDIVRALMSLRQTVGDRAGAIQEYRAFEQRLHTELDAPPMPETSALYATLIQQTAPAQPSPAESLLAATILPHSGSSPPPSPLLISPTVASLSPSSPPPIASPPSSNLAHHNLPTQLTSFIGREEELTELRRLLTCSEETVRLLTLTAAGGSGKTRLAIQLAASVAPAYRDGVWWVDLSPVIDERLTAQVVTKALGLSITPQQGFAIALVEHLQAKQALLVLDNCEHLIEECAALAQNLLSHCPHLQLLTTSREALKIPGETTWLAPLLAVPRRGSVPSLPALRDYPAIQLFVERARALLPSFLLTTQNAAAVAQVCQRLDGMPLAIELAAARVKVLSVDQIAARLDDRFRLLRADSRTVLPRYQTLRATIDWSYDLLTADERSLLQRLAIFTGGCTLEAVESVVTDDPVLDDEAPLDVLTRLVEKSLVVVQQHDEQRTRYALLETIRAYALEKLVAAGDETTVRRRHRDWFLQRAEEIATGMNGAQQTLWLAEMDAEYENFQSAIEWSAQTAGEASTGLRFASLLRHYWDRHGYLREAAFCLQRLLSHPENRGESAIRATALNHLGFFAFLLGDLAAAVAHFEEALTIGRAVDHLPTVAQAYGNLALVLTGSPDPARAHPYIAQGLAVARAIQDRKQIYTMLFYDSWLAMVEDDYARSHKLLAESLHLMREEGDHVRLAAALWRLGHLCWLERHYAQSLTAFTESLTLRLDLKSRRGIAYAIDGVAWVAASTGQAQLAVRLFGATDTHFSAMDTHFHPIEQPAHDAALSAARQALDAATFTTAWAEGQALSLEEAITLALGVVLPATPSPHCAPERAVIEAADHGKPAIPGTLTLSALGAVRVCVADHPLSAADWTYARAKELLFYLLTYGPATREQIGLAFWPDAAPEQLRRNLGVTLHHLRRALGHNEWVLFENDQYSFNRTLNYWYDVEAFTTLCQQAQSSSDMVAHWQAAIALYRGEFMADSAGGEWCFARRERLAQHYERALLALGQAYSATGAYDQAAEIYRRAIAHDPYLESAYRELMRALVAMGERGQALRVYTELTKLMQKEFNSPPSRETQSIYELVRNG